jgi:hypothetical protein
MVGVPISFADSKALHQRSHRQPGHLQPVDSAAKSATAQWSMMITRNIWRPALKDLKRRCFANEEWQVAPIKSDPMDQPSSWAIDLEIVAC